MGPTTAARTFSPVSAAAVRLHGHSHQPLAPTPPAPTTVATATIAAPDPCSRPRPCHRRGGLAPQLSPPPTSPPLTPARATPPALPRPLPPPPPQPRRSSAPACPITDAAAAETRPPSPDRCPRHHNLRGCCPPMPSQQRTPAPLTPARAPPTAAPATTTAASLGGGVAGGVVAVAPPPLQGGASRRGGAACSPAVAVQGRDIGQRRGGRCPRTHHAVLLSGAGREWAASTVALAAAADAPAPVRWGCRGVALPVCLSLSFPCAQSPTCSTVSIPHITNSPRRSKILL